MYTVKQGRLDPRALGRMWLILCHGVVPIGQFRTYREAKKIADSLNRTTSGRNAASPRRTRNEAL